MTIKFFRLGEEMAVVGRITNNVLTLIDTLIEADHPEHVLDVKAFIEKFNGASFKTIEQINKTLKKTYIVAEPY